jgi:hypothetical protein
VLDKRCKQDSEYANDKIIDNTQITTIIYILYIMRTTYLMICISTIVYFGGIVWFDIVEWAYNHRDLEDTDDMYFYSNT